MNLTLTLTLTPIPRKERVLLEKRGALIVRQLCEHLAPRKVFVTLTLTPNPNP